MIPQFEPVVNAVHAWLPDWEKKLLELDDAAITIERNSQDRNIKQILGHMIDSASNNLHRIIHLQYQESPLTFPNYATYGNNDRWIAIQNYEEEDWFEMVQLWKYSHLHFIHVVRNVKKESIQNVWIADKETDLVSLEEMVIDFIRHFKLHLGEITELIK